MRSSKTVKGLAVFMVAGALGLCLGPLWTLSASAAGPTAATSAGPSLQTRSFAAASIRALPGLQCTIHPAGSAPSAGVSVFTNDDGYARFYAVKMTAGDAVKQLTMDCTDAAGKPSSYSIDLTSDETFAPNPLNLANERGTDRPALRGDPLSFTESQLLDAGYGLRPDPIRTPSAYAAWLTAASKPGRLLQTTNSSVILHDSMFPPRLPQKVPLTPQDVGVSRGGPWYGAVLTGAPNYVYTYATFNIPAAIPGGDQTTNTAIYIWNGLGGNGNSGLIQFFVWIQTSTMAASYSTAREYCCNDHQFTANGANVAPSPGDLVLDEAWYCDANGTQNINGGYGCAYFDDLTSGAIVSCTSSQGQPCSSVKALPLCTTDPTLPNCMVLGESAEFIIENGTAGALTDFSPTVNIEGWAATSAGGSTYSVGYGPFTTLLTDTSASAHSSGPYMAVGINPEFTATCFTVSQSFSAAIGPCGGGAPAPVSGPPVGGGGPLPECGKGTGHPCPIDACGPGTGRNCLPQ
jgi:hypothetical protein